MKPIMHLPGDPGYVEIGSERHQAVVGASRAADILGHGFKDADYHWRLLTGKAKPEPHKRIFDRGHAMEPHILGMLELETYKRTGAEPPAVVVRERQAQFTDPTRPWLVCHIDGAVAEHRSLGTGEKVYDGSGYVEAKAPGSRMASQYKDCGLGSNYVAQGQIIGHLGQFEWGRFVFLDYDEWEIIPFDVPTSHDYLVPALQMLDYFWSCVLADTPPVELRTAVTKDLPQIGGEVELLTSAEETDLFVEMVRMQLLEGDVKKEREDLKARFRKSHDLGKYHVPGVGKISRRMQDGKLSWDSQGLSDFVELAAAKHGFSYDPAMFNKRGADFEVINVYPDKEMRGS